MRSCTRDPLPEQGLCILRDLYPQLLLGASLLLKERAIRATKEQRFEQQAESCTFKVQNKHLKVFLWSFFLSNDTLELFPSEANVCLFHSGRKQIHGVVPMRNGQPMPLPSSA